MYIEEPTAEDLEMVRKAVKESEKAFPKELLEKITGSGFRVFGLGRGFSIVGPAGSGGPDTDRQISALQKQWWKAGERIKDNRKF